MGVKTSVTYQTAEYLEFPSITFCSTYPYKRAQFGNATQTDIILAYNLAKNEKELAPLIKIIGRTCKSDYKSKYVKLIDQYGYDYLFHGMATPKMFFDSLASCVTNFKTDVQKCWVNRREVECEQIFIDKPVDDNLCFTYNIGAEFAKLYINTTIDNKAILRTFNNRAVQNMNDRPKSIRFLLKSNQSDFCGTEYIKRGAGYFAMLTERDATPIIMYNTPIYMSPGYINNVIIKPIEYRRNTEKMGLCRSKSNVFLVLSTNKYMQSLCYFQCIMGAFLHACHCYPGNYMMFHDLFVQNAHNYNISKESVKVCLDSGLMCVRRVQEKEFFDMSTNRRCPECNTQCYEKKYDYRLTRLTMSVNQLKKNIPENIAEEMDDAQLRKNYIDVSFSFESNYIEVFEESQAVTIIDMFINLGNNFMLFLGMSFLNTFEITNELIFPLFLHFCKKLFCIKQRLFSRVDRIKLEKSVEAKMRKKIQRRKMRKDIRCAIRIK